MKLKVELKKQYILRKDRKFFIRRKKIRSFKIEKYLENL